MEAPVVLESDLVHGFNCLFGGPGPAPRAQPIILISRSALPKEVNNVTRPMMTGPKTEIYEYERNLRVGSLNKGLLSYPVNHRLVTVSFV